MIGNTIAYEVDADSFGLTLINEGNFSSEYQAKNSLTSCRIRIRHSKEKPSAVDGIAYDRHNVEFTYTTYPTASLPKGRNTQVYFVIRSDPNSDGTEAADMMLGVLSLLGAEAEFITKVINWES